MADPNTTQERNQGASAYDTSTTGGDGEKITPKVGVYDRPANAGRAGGMAGMSTMNLIIGLILLLIIGFVVWQVVF